MRIYFLVVAAGSDGNMPAFSDKLNEKQVDSLVSLFGNSKRSNK